MNILISDKKFEDDLEEVVEENNDIVTEEKEDKKDEDNDEELIEVKEEIFKLPECFIRIFFFNCNFLLK